MVQKDLTVLNALGLHARAAKKLVTCAQGFPCDAFAVKNEKRHSLKSILDVMLLGCKRGETLHLEFDGPDEARAAEAVAALFAQQFGEPD